MTPPMIHSLTFTLAEVSRVPLYVIMAYMTLLLILGYASSHFFRGTSADFFVASRSIGPFLLLMSVFGTTMTAFALIGSTAKSFDLGIGVYGLMASWSGLIHSAVFFLVGIKLWAIGKRYGYVTQVQYFRDRFQSNALGMILFPVLVGLVIPYLLIGLLGAGAVMRGVTAGMFPEAFAASNGAIPQWLTGLVVSGVVLFYIFFGGVRGAAWANTFQTLVFMTTGVVTFYLIARGLGGMSEASAKVLEHAPQHMAREGMISKSQFFTYCFVPLSVGMFPHLFQHWLTARSAKTFRLTVIAHPIFIMIVWVPCILIGMWAAGMAATGELRVPNSNAVLGRMVDQLVHSPVLTGLLISGVLAAIMSSLDSQFICLGTMFTQDVVVHHAGEGRLSDRQKLWTSRGFIVTIVALTYVLSLFEPRHVFDLGVWCFSGFAALFPLVFASLYWRRVTRAGALACVLVTGAVWCVLFADDVVFKETSFFGSSGAGEEYLVFGVMPVAVIFGASALTLVGVSFVTRPLPDKVIGKFFDPCANPLVAPPAGEAQGKSGD